MPSFRQVFMFLEGGHGHIYFMTLSAGLLVFWSILLFHLTSDQGSVMHKLKKRNWMEAKPLILRIKKFLMILLMASEVFLRFLK